jgi:hypothetical protein
MAGDPQWGNVVLAMPMEGGSISDVHGHTWFSSGVSLSTAQYKFGAKALYSAGTGGAANAYGLSGEFHISGAEWTLEAFVRPENNSVNLAIISKSSGGVTWTFGLESGTSTPRLLLLLSGTVNYFSGTLATEEWHHVALVSTGGVISAYIDGTKSASTYTASLPYGNDRIFIAGDEDGVYSFKGYIDSLYITNNYARYTASFTPRTAEFSPPIFSGTVEGMGGGDVARVVSIRRSDGAIAGTVNNVTSTFTVPALDFSEHYLVCFDMTIGESNALIVDSVIAI